MTRGPGLSVGVARHAFVPSPIFVGLLALVGLSGWLTWNGVGSVRVDVFLFVISGWLVSLCLHEYAHAVVAYVCGDRSVAEKGYLRLNPLKYTHPLLSIGLPVVAVILGGIGLPGGAVWVDHRHIGGRLRQSLVSLAGPATNVALALALAIPFLAGAAEVPQRRTDAAGQSTLQLSAHFEFWAALALLAFLQVTASVLNLLPVPGLDGGNLVFPWLNEQWKRAFNLIAPYGFILLFAALWQPEINRYFFTAVHWVSDAIGIPRLLSDIGFELMRFWSAWI